MWIFTTFGFFSVTETRNDYVPGTRTSEGYEDVETPPIQPNGTLQVRGRFAEDLDNLRERYLPELSKTYSMPWRDYPYRAFTSKASFSAAMVQIVHDLTYNNFKATVAAEQSHDRSHLYGGVWGVMSDAESRLERKRKKKLAKTKQSSFDGFGRSYMDPWLYDDTTPVDLRSNEELDRDAERSISLLGPEFDSVLFTDETPILEPAKKPRRRRRKTGRVVTRKRIVKGGRKK